MSTRAFFLISSCIKSSYFQKINKNVFYQSCRHKLTFVDPIIQNVSLPMKTKAGRWLLALSGMTFGAVALGGTTRLTKSGLSMVDWHFFKEIPPLTQLSWEREFEKYKQFPEYQHVIREHGEMSLSRFKFIWYMEYIHRMWGRLIGIGFVVPAAYMYFAGYFNRRMNYRVLAYGLLIAFQGLLGWYMVKSGLETPKSPVGADPNEPFVGVPRVSHYRLAAHLTSAVVLYALFLWASFSHLATHPIIAKFDGLKRLKILTHSTKTMMFITLIFGAFVAGLNAGLVYNSWPKMADRWVPEDLVVPRYGSVLRNMLENPTAVQFLHRIFAYTTVGLSIVTWGLTMAAGRARTGGQIRNAAHFMLAACLGQSALGIATLVHYVPVPLGVLHQSGSLILLSTILWLSHCLRAVPK